MSQFHLSRLLTAAWQHRGPLTRALWPISLLMGGIVGLRRLAYARGWLRATRLPVPVLVVGNRIAGGAGKTPTTIALLRHLKARGWTPGVLSRGYGATERPPGPLLLDTRSQGRVTAAQCGDEPLLIWRRTQVPLMVGPDRASCGQALLSAHPDIDLLVCDDGLQHLRLQRDVEVIVFDERGAGNGWLLPAGPLREPWNSAPPPGLAAAPLVLYNAPHATTPLRGHRLRPTLGQPLALLDWWRGETPQSHRLDARQTPTVWALAGIAQPQRFFDALSRQGFEVRPLPLPDHADFITLPWPETVQDLVVTEKDAVKLRPERLEAERPHTRTWVAGLDFEPEDGFWPALDAALAVARDRQLHRPHSA